MRYNLRVEQLMERVKVFTRKRGSKVKLARHLGITRQQLNRWLCGDLHPCGQMALELQDWADRRTKEHSQIEPS